MIKIDERYCIFPQIGVYGLYLHFEPPPEGENDACIRIISVRRDLRNNKITLNKSPMSKDTLARVTKTGKLNRQLRILLNMAPDLIRKLALFVEEYMGDTVVQQDPLVKKTEERAKERAVEDDLSRFSEFK